MAGVAPSSPGSFVATATSPSTHWIHGGFVVRDSLPYTSTAPPPPPQVQASSSISVFCKGKIDYLQLQKALDTAAIQGHIDIVNLLLETDASLAKIARNNGKIVLHSAARMGHVEVVRSLLNKDPGIGLRTDKKGQTTLHMASKGQNAEMVVELLKLDVSIIHLEDNKENRPLHVGTRKGHIIVVVVCGRRSPGTIVRINREVQTRKDSRGRISKTEQKIVELSCRG